MAFKDDVLTFVKEAEYKIATLNDEIATLEDDSKRNNKRYRMALDQMEELSMLVEIVLVTNMVIDDGAGNEVLNFSDMTDAEVYTLMSDVKVHYDLVVSPYGEFPFLTTPYVTIGTSSGSASSLPEGGLPGWHLVLDSNFNPVWAPMPSVIEGGTL